MQAKAYLFDIDGTLIATGGAGSAASTIAFERRYGFTPSYEGWHPWGATDLGLFRDLLERNLPDERFSESDIADFLADYVQHLQASLDMERYRILPGAKELVAELHAAGRILGLATGNIERAARIKIDPAAFNPYFAFGGFGDDGKKRADIVEAAFQRALQRDASLKRKDVVVVGDTPADVQAARACGLRCVAVASSIYDAEALAREKPDWILESLSDWVFSA